MSTGKYAEVMARRGTIMQRALGLDYDQFEREGGVAFDYEGLVGSPAYDLDAVRRIQAAFKVGNTPLWELPRLSELVRQTAPRGQGARILIKDEAGNAAGSFKARRASLAVAHAADLGYEGVVAATSGNYGAAVASQAAMRGIKAIILQEVFDSKWRGQPEILEKTRVCEAYGAEVWQVTVGPELFYWHLITLEETGFFNASLYTPYGILGIETLGYEIAEQCRAQFGRDPAAMLITHSGGGNVTGTARGLRRAGADPEIIGVSVDLTGLHMASDHDFNRKSFTTGHTGFGFPFTVNPDRVDVPRNAARGLLYLDRYVSISGINQRIGGGTDGKGRPGRHPGPGRGIHRPPGLPERPAPAFRDRGGLGNVRRLGRLPPGNQHRAGDESDACGLANKHGSPFLGEGLFAC